MKANSRRFAAFGGQNIMLREHAYYRSEIQALFVIVVKEQK